MNKPLKIYNASAGSGKTYTLVQEYFRLILKNKDPMVFRTILAMTFTNKAAKEMKTRVVEGLIDLSTPTNKKTEKQIKFFNDTVKNLELDPNFIVEHSANILNKILHNYSSFSIMTIDKFTHRIIRTFAKDLGISVDFDLEMDVNALRKNATDTLFEKIGKNKELTRLMQMYATDNLKNDKSWNFSNHLFNFSSHLFKEDAIKPINKLKKFDGKAFDKIKDETNASISKFENQIISIASQAIDLINKNHLKAEDFHSKSNSIVKYFKNLTYKNKLLLKSDSTSPFTTTIKKNIENGKWAHPTSNNKTIIESISSLLEQYYNQIDDIYTKQYGNYVLNINIRKNLNNLSLLNHLKLIIEDIKKEDNVLLISDFYKKIASIIAEEPVPFIYERIGTRYQHYLLDEFQDTSQLQWVNMIPLVHESLSSGNMNLIVGDGKQAIYRWRNGEVEQFTQLPDNVYNPDNILTLNEAGRKFKQEGIKIPLKNNFRSSKEVIEFNNSLFLHLQNKLAEPLQYIYDDVKQTPIKTHKGYVNALIKNGLEKDEQLEYAYQAILKSLALGYQLNDICIIVRKKDKGALLASYLMDRNIEVISADSLFIGKDIYVKFMHHLMHAIISPNNKNYKIKAIEHFANIKNKSVSELLNIAENTLFNSTIGDYFKQFNINILKPEQFHNLYEFVESLIEAFNFDPSDNPYLQFFLENVLQFELKNNSNLRDYLDWFKDKGFEKSIISPEGANSVQIMTIHASKGLQFPVVICSFFDWGFRLNEQVSWVEDNDNSLPAYFVKMTQQIKTTKIANVYNTEEGKYYLDEINTIYVAFTRPETALFISGNSRVSSPMKLWIAEFIEKSDLFVKNKNNEFEYGDFEYNPKEIQKLPKNYNLVYLKQKMNKPQLSFKSGNEWDVNDINQKRNFGTLVHLVLSKIDNINSLNKTLNLLKTKGIIKQNEIKEIEIYITNLFKNSHFKSYFNVNKVLNEKPIINSKGHKLIPDKIIIEDNSTLIVDFKTGQKTESHLKQLQRYVNLLKTMNYKNVRGELFYTETKEIVTV